MKSAIAQRRYRSGSAWGPFLIVLGLFAGFMLIWKDAKPTEVTKDQYQSFLDEATKHGPNETTVKSGEKMVLPVEHDIFYDGFERGYARLKAYIAKKPGEKPEINEYPLEVSKYGETVFATADLRQVCSVPAVIYITSASPESITYTIQDTRSKP